MPPKRSRKPKARQLCAAIKPGTVVTDGQKVEVTVGTEFAVGGFGRICNAKVSGKTGTFVIKFEPKDGGGVPLETSALLRFGKQAAIEEYRKKNGKVFVGVPPLISFGMHNDLRYIVIPKYNHTLTEAIENAGGRFHVEQMSQAAKSILSTLRYLQEQNYVHLDIKPDNVLYDHDLTECYLIDYGLCSVVSSNVVDKDDPSRAHNGTALYTSTDAHRGIRAAFRADVEILAHNALFWATGALPWKDAEEDLDELKRRKLALIESLDSELPKLISDAPSREIVKILYRASQISVKSKVDYDKLIADITAVDIKPFRKHRIAQDMPTPAKKANNQTSSRSKKIHVPESSPEPEPEESEEDEPAPPTRGRKPRTAAAAKPPLPTPQKKTKETRQPNSEAPTPSKRTRASPSPTPSELSSVRRSSRLASNVIPEKLVEPSPKPKKTKADETPLAKAQKAKRTAAAEAPTSSNTRNGIIYPGLTTKTVPKTSNTRTPSPTSNSRSLKLGGINENQTTPVKAQSSGTPHFLHDYLKNHHCVTPQERPYPMDDSSAPRPPKQRSDFVLMTRNQLSPPPMPTPVYNRRRLDITPIKTTPTKKRTFAESLEHEETISVEPVDVPKPYCSIM